MPVFALMVKLTNKIMVFAACLLASSFKISEVTGGPGDTYHRPVPGSINNPVINIPPPARISPPVSTYRPVINEPRQNQRTLFQDTIGRAYTWLAGGIKKIINKASAYTSSIRNQISEATAESELTPNVETQAIVSITNTETQTIALQPHIQISAAINEFHIQKEPKPFFQGIIKKLQKIGHKITDIRAQYLNRSYSEISGNSNSTLLKLKKLYVKLEYLREAVADKISRDATQEDLPANYQELGLNQEETRIIDFDSIINGMAEDLGLNDFNKYKDLQKIGNFRALLEKLEEFFNKQIFLIRRYGEISIDLYSVDETLPQSRPDIFTYISYKEKEDAYKNIGVDSLMREFRKLENNSTAREILTLFLAVNEIISKVEPDHRIPITFFSEFYTPNFQFGGLIPNTANDCMLINQHNGLPLGFNLRLRDKTKDEVAPVNFCLAPADNNTFKIEHELPYETNRRLVILHEFCHYIHGYLGLVGVIDEERPSDGISQQQSQFFDNLVPISNITNDNSSEFADAFDNNGLQSSLKDLAKLDTNFIDTCTNLKYIDGIFTKLKKFNNETEEWFNSTIIAPLMYELTFDSIFHSKLELLQVLGLYINKGKLYANRLADFCIYVNEGMAFRHLYVGRNFNNTNMVQISNIAEVINSCIDKVYSIKPDDNAINALFTIHGKDPAKYRQKYRETQQALQNAQSTTSQVPHPYPGYTPLFIHTQSQPPQQQLNTP